MYLVSRSLGWSFTNLLNRNFPFTAEKKTFSKLFSHLFPLVYSPAILKNLILLLQPYELWFSELVNDCPTYRLEEKKWTVKNVETIIFGRGLLLRLLFLTTVLARSDVLIKKRCSPSKPLVCQYVYRVKKYAH